MAAFLNIAWTLRTRSAGIGAERDHKHAGEITPMGASIHSRGVQRLRCRDTSMAREFSRDSEPLASRCALTPTGAEMSLAPGRLAR